ncbi:MAG: hypothetical protein WD040_04165 [Anaerolineales bacterium]
MSHSARAWVRLTLLGLAALACSLTGSTDSTIPPTPITDSGFLSAESGGRIEGPQGATLEAEPGGLTMDTVATITVAGDGVPFAEASPLQQVSPEFMVDLGEAEATGLVTLSLPLPTASQSMNREASLPRESAQAGGPIYVAQTYNDEGVPRMLGVMVESDRATFQVLDTGLYQLYKIVPYLTTVFDPLHVPSYAQHTPAWCSPTALTDLVQYHEGSWPAGGDGSVWGESSNWYLAGQAAQPFDSGYFFHWLVAAGGFAGVPGDVKQSFTLNDLEVMIWFTGQVEAPWNELVWAAFRAYVESYLWGENIARRPVAWGSSIAGHSRVITGSDGTNFYYNETSNGSINLTKTWQDYHDDAVDLDQDEVIDTTVIFHDPRPENQRRGVIWLYPQKSNTEGSIVIHKASDDTVTAYWHWDGTSGRELGYYYDDPQSVHTSDPTLDVAFQPSSEDDYLAYEFKLANIGGANYDYQVQVHLYPDGSPSGMLVGTHNSPAIAPKGTWGPESGQAVIGGLSPGMYVLRFRLYQNGVLQDIKYVKFRIAPPDVPAIPELIPINPLIPFEDPELSTFELYYRGGGCGPKTVMFDIQATNPQGQNVVLFYRLMDEASGDSTEFNPGVAMRPLGDGFFTYELMAEDVPEFSMFDSAMLQYQFVLTDAAGAILGRSSVYSDLSFMICHR